MAPRLLTGSLVQNGETPKAVTVLLLAADRRDTSLASASAAIALDSRSRLAPLAGVPTSGAREGAGRPGAQRAPKGASRDDRFVPLAAVVPTAHVTH
jgi:hypothetical protein